MEECRRWVLLADAQNRTGLAAKLDRAEVALAVVSPRRFVPGYRSGWPGAKSSHSVFAIRTTRRCW